MPLRLDIKRKLSARSDRVKCVDLHPTEPWMLASLYNGNVHVWNHESQQLVKSFEVCDLPVRAAKFIARLKADITVCPTCAICVHDRFIIILYSRLRSSPTFTLQKLSFRKHWVITGSDDMQVRIFNYNTLERIHSFEAHSDYIRSIAVHPTQSFVLTCRYCRVWWCVALIR